jgi:hypothetical protein
MFKSIFHRRRLTLADCSACGADFVHPVEWSPEGGDHWWMLLRCGSCGASREELVPDLDAELFDRALNRAENGMRLAADRLGREALEQEAEAFAAALELDLICADDFSR